MKRKYYLHTVNILKHCFRGVQYRSCHPPGILAQGFFIGSLHGGGTIAQSLMTIMNKIQIHCSKPFITANFLFTRKMIKEK